jgi:AraC-like DNA-binding protein
MAQIKYDELKRVPDIDISVRFCNHWQRDRSWNFSSISNPFTTFWIVVSGSRELEVGGNCYPVERGNIVVIPPNHPLRTRNRAQGGDTFEYLSLGAVLKVNGLEWDHYVRLPSVTRIADPGVFASLAAKWGEMQSAWDSYLGTLKPGLALGDNLAGTSRFYGLLHHWFAELLACVPLEWAGAGARRALDERLVQAMEYMEQNLSCRMRLEDLAGQCFVSVGHLRQLFQKQLRTSPMKYLTTLRIRKGKELLALTRLPLSEVASLTGYGDANHFGKAFRQQEHMSPGEYRRRSLSQLD